MIYVSLLLLWVIISSKIFKTNPFTFFKWRVANKIKKINFLLEKINLPFIFKLLS